MVRNLINRKWWIIGGVFTLLVGVLIYNLYWQALPQPLAAFLPTLSSPKSTDTILMIAPHPDDETISSAGYLSDAVGAGATVWITLVTDGNKHGLEKKRYAEFNTVLDRLGVLTNHRLFLNYPDGQLNKVKTTELSSKLQSVIQQVRPTIVLVPHSHDSHPDHRITGQVADSLLAATPQVVVYHYLVHYPQFPSPHKFLPEDSLLPPLRLVSFQDQWYRYPLDSQAVDLKLEALLQYKTQLATPFLRELFYASVRQNELFSSANLPQ